MCRGGVILRAVETRRREARDVERQLLAQGEGGGALAHARPHLEGVARAAAHQDDGGQRRVAAGDVTDHIIVVGGGSVQA